MTDENGGADSVGKELKTCAVFGGRGFIGRALVERLLRLGNWIVRVADFSQSCQLHPSESFLEEAISSGRASYFHVDVRHKSQIVRAIEGVSVVFYTESLDAFSHDFYFCYMIVVQGAKNLLNACQECHVKRLVYSSSADVVCDNTHDICNGDESLPYSGQLTDMITDLKTQAEALVLRGNDIGGLLTCAIRPCNVFGPGDNHLIPSIIHMAKSSWAKFIVGNGDRLSDFTYVDNVAHALICAEESLCSQMVSVSGKVFFITNLEPMKFWEFASLVLEGFGYNRPVVSLPVWLVRSVFTLTKLIHVNSDSRRTGTCASVYHLVALASRSRTFSCLAAQRHLQYSPVVSTGEAVALTVDSFSHSARASPFVIYNDSDELSKMDMLLGSGEVAEILLWRDEKKTFVWFVLLGLLYLWFFLSGRTFISSVTKLLLLVIVLLCGHSILSCSVYGPRIPRLSSSYFEISEVDMRKSFLAMARMWNRLDCLTKSLAQGDDWSTFLKVSALLYLCKLIVPHHLSTVAGVALVLAFTLCFVYEQYEEGIDGIIRAVLAGAQKIVVLCTRNLLMPMPSVSTDL